MRDMGSSVRQAVRRYADANYLRCRLSGLVGARLAIEGSGALFASCKRWFFDTAGNAKRRQWPTATPNVQITSRTVHHCRTRPSWQCGQNHLVKSHFDSSLCPPTLPRAVLLSS